MGEWDGYSLPVALTGSRAAWGAPEQGSWGRTVELAHVSFSGRRSHNCCPDCLLSRILTRAYLRQLAHRGSREWGSLVWEEGTRHIWAAKGAMSEPVAFAQEAGPGATGLPRSPEGGPTRCRPAESEPLEWGPSKASPVILGCSKTLGASEGA